MKSLLIFFSTLEHQLLRNIANLHEWSADCLGEFVQQGRSGLIARATKDELEKLNFMLDKCGNAVQNAIKNIDIVVNKMRAIAKRESAQ